MNQEPLQMESCEPPAALNVLLWPVVTPKNRVGGSAAFSFAFASQFIGEPFDPNTLLPSTLSYYGYDGHGNVRFLMDTNGAVTDTYQYDAFGNLLNSTGSTPNNYLYSGQQFDLDLGLYYNRARYLAPSIDRFMTMGTFAGNNEDPLSLHKYLYAEDDPVNKKDPSGHDAWALSGFTIGFTIEAVVLVQLSVDYQKLHLSNEQISSAISANNDAMARLNKIISSDGQVSFQDENLTAIGKYGIALSGPEPFRKAINLFESKRNVERAPSAAEESAARSATGVWTPAPTPGSAGDSDGNRVILATALLHRTQAFDRWIHRLY